MLGRFVPVVRTYVPLAAGTARMPLGRFATWNVVGAVAWVGVLVTAGVLLGGVPLVADHIDAVMVVVVVVSVLPSSSEPSSAEVARPGSNGDRRDAGTRLVAQEVHPERRTVGRTERAVLLRGAVVLAVVGSAVFSVMLVGVLGHGGGAAPGPTVEQWFDAHRDGDLTGGVGVRSSRPCSGRSGCRSSCSWSRGVGARFAARVAAAAAGVRDGARRRHRAAARTDRAAPRPPVGLMLLAPDHTFSFPSGHVLGASDFF